jgi:hypothetical protein
MKATADALRDVGRTITDAELVLNLLRGLNPRFASTADNIADSHPLPDFTTTREKLVLKELRLANEGTVAAQTALHASCGTSCRTTPTTNGGGSTASRQGGHGNSSSSDGNPGGGGCRWKKGKGGPHSGGGPRFPAAPWYCYPPWTVGVHQQPWRPPAPTPAWRSPGILGPFTQAQAHTALAPVQSSDNPAPPMAAQGGWDQAGLIAALNQMSLQGSSPWVLDTGATAHMSSSDGILLSHLPPPSFGITVGNGTTIPITCRGTSILSSPTSTYRLNNVLVAPALVRNLLSVRQFTRDNSCSIEFDAYGFSVKDKQTGHVTLRCSSGGDLYTYPSTTTPSCSLATTSSLWHHRLGHPGPSSLAKLRSMSVISFNKSSPCL